jgi:hypothetical protein
MKRTAKIAYLFAVLAVLFSAAVLGIAIGCRDLAPVLVSVPEEAGRQG